MSGLLSWEAPFCLPHPLNSLSSALFMMLAERGFLVNNVNQKLCHTRTSGEQRDGKGGGSWHRSTT